MSKQINLEEREFKVLQKQSKRQTKDFKEKKKDRIHQLAILSLTKKNKM